MIPIQLSIKGLYSYKEKQVIDFSPLVASGLFGIFGTVGSGKSTILEAIMFVLYRNSDRLTASGRNYNMMNLQCNEMIIDFLFYAGDRNSEKYRAYYHSRRNSKNFDEVKVKDHCFYRWENNDWVPLPDTQDATMLTGLPFRNFMQAVIIPQGKFREFVDQTPAARTQMLKDIFHLEKFDLSTRTNQLLYECKNQMSNLEGRLAELGEVSQEDIMAISAEIKEVEGRVSSENGIIERLQKEETILAALKQLFEKINQSAEALAILEQEQEFYEEKKKQLEIYRKAYTHFKEKIHRLHEITRELKERKDKADHLRREYTQKEEMAGTAIVALTAATEALKQEDDVREKCADLQLIIEIKNLQADIDRLARQQAEAKSRLEKTRDSLSEGKLSLKKLEKETAWLEEKTANAAQLTDISHWLVKKAELESELQRARTLLTGYEQQQNAVAGKKKALLKPAENFSANLPFSELFTKIQQEKDTIRAGIVMIDERIQPLLVKQQLADYAGALEPGKACPLCGSEHHPDIAGIRSVTSEIKEEQLQIEQLKLKEVRLEALFRAARELEAEYHKIAGLLDSQLAIVRDLQEKLEKHQATFRWEAYRKIDGQGIRQLIAENEAGVKELKALRKEMVRLGEIRDLAEKRKEDQEEKVKKIEYEKIGKTSEKGRMQKLLKRFQYEKFQNHSLEALQESLKKGKQQLASLREVYEDNNKRVNALNNELSQIKGRLATEENELSTLLDKSEEMDQKMREEIWARGFKNIAVVREVLAQNLDIEAEEKAISAYNQQLFSARQTHGRLRKEAADQSYDEGRHIQVKDEMENATARIDMYKQQLALKRQEMILFKEKIKTLKKLQEDWERLENRRNNLSEFAALFRGSGFVNYVSSIYLNDLCRAANQRFFKLTRNNLSLELNEQNEFMVRDYLNNGKTRLLKTLSGGQTFQAALCLALALAEQVKSLNSAQQSFFFLDEGFGSLDKASLQIVFETLKSLRKENRIVGIISHVEELQQETEIFLKVENDRDRGSLVSRSWE